MWGRHARKDDASCGMYGREESAQLADVCSASDGCAAYGHYMDPHTHVRVHAAVRGLGVQRGVHCFAVVSARLTRAAAAAAGSCARGMPHRQVPSPPSRMPCDSAPRGTRRAARGRRSRGGRSQCHQPSSLRECGGRVGVSRRATGMRDVGEQGVCCATLTLPPLDHYRPARELS